MKTKSGPVVLLVRNVAPEHFGGGEIYQLSLAKELKKAGFEPIIITKSRRLSEDALSADIKVVKSPYMRNQNWSGWRNLLLPVYFIYQKYLMWWYVKLIKKYNPAVINIQSRDEMIAATQASRKAGVKIIWTDHADFLNWTLVNVNKRLKNPIGKKIVRLSKYVSAVVFVSESIKEQTERMIRPLKIENSVVIENGVMDRMAKKSDIVTEPGSFVYIGRVVKEKGIEELIRAFLVVEKKHPETRLSIYGDGEIEKYKSLVPEKSKIVFCGYIDKPESALARNDIFVLPSHMEGMSLSLLDAAMMGKKIIVTDVGGNSEIVANGRTGLIIAPRDEKKLAKAMMYMLEHRSEAASMANAVRRLYEEKFDFDKIFAEKMLPLYNNIKEKTK